LKGRNPFTPFDRLERGIRHVIREEQEFEIVRNEFREMHREDGRRSAKERLRQIDPVFCGSGLDPREEDWVARDSLPDTLRELLAEIGRCYVPLLIANEKAVNARAERVSLTLDGQQWEQQPYPYQAKCLQWLRQEYGRLEGEDRLFVDQLLAGTGCEALFTINT